MESIELKVLIFQDNRINFMPGTEVVDEEERVLILADGKKRYSKNTGCLGSEYFMPPIPNFRP